MKNREFIFGQVRKASEDTRTITFVASDNSKDAHGTILPVDKWDLTRFSANPVIGYQHALSYSDDPDDVIGTGKAYIEEDELLIDITFEPEDINPLAEKVYKKVKHGTLKAVSVGFVPTKEGRMGDKNKGEDPNTYYFDGQELIEVSVVNVPSNKNALKKAMEMYRSLLDINPEEIAQRELEKEAIEKAEQEKLETEKVEVERLASEALQKEFENKVKKIEETIIIAEAKALLLISNN